MLSYIIVGSGYRAEYFGRVAKTYPSLFRAMFLCRSEEKKERMTAHTGIPATTDGAECLAFQPDFVVIAVDRGHMTQVAEEWIQKGFPVVTETPVGESPDQLCRLWALGKQGAKIVSCEQYHRVPMIACGLQAVQDGLIGEPDSVYISLLHDYHAASVIRPALRLSGSEKYTVIGMEHTGQVAATDSREGAILDGRTQPAVRMTAQIIYDCGKHALYDFCTVQYRSYIRSRHLVVRGSRGEWSDQAVSFVNENNRPEKLFLLPDLPEKYRCLDTQALRDRRRNWQPDLAPDTVQDEYAIASILLDMEDYLRGGPSPYSLENSLNDAYFWILLKAAAQNPLQPVRSEEMPWMI